MATILIVEDQPENQNLYDTIVSAVENELGLQFSRRLASDSEEAQSALDQGLENPEESPILILLDMEIRYEGHLDVRGGYKLMEAYRWKFPNAYWVPLTAHIAWHERATTGESALFDDLYRLQPFDVFSKGRISDLREIVYRALKLVRSTQGLDSKEERNTVTDTVISFNGCRWVPPRYRLYHEIRSAAESKRWIILFGESGTGKALTAHVIHYYSNRLGDRFSVADGTIGGDSLEQVLFPPNGERSDEDSKPLLEQVQEGTLYVRNLDHMDARLQRRLLHHLRYRGYDVRVIGGIEQSRRDIPMLDTILPELKDMMIPLDLPPLRERKEDVPELVKLFIDEFNQQRKERGEKLKEVIGRSKIYQFLQAQNWRRGNIAELRMLVEEVLLKTTAPVVTVEDFEKALLPFASAEQDEERVVGQGQSLGRKRRRIVVTEEDIRRYG